MRRVIINSEVNAKALALLCSRIQNQQSHGVIISDCFEMLHYGEHFKITSSDELTTGSLYASKLNSIIIVVVPKLVDAETPVDFNTIVELVEKSVEETTLEKVENTVLYLGSTCFADKLLKDITEQTESTLVNLKMYREYLRLEKEFTWKDSAEEQVTEEQGKYLTYTCIYSKKDAKKAAKLKNEVLLISNKDYDAVKRAEKLNKWNVSGIFRALAIEVMGTHMSMKSTKNIASWLDKAE